MLNPLDSAQLLAFVAVARERGFSRAARRLGRTQSAVSQAVARLEADSRRGALRPPRAHDRAHRRRADAARARRARARRDGPGPGEPHRRG
ncbi:MAG: LysR family transcriptional regulator [Anaeromyxobacteraceae bacterium]